MGRVIRTHLSIHDGIRKVYVLCKTFKGEDKGKNDKTTKMIEIERAVHNLVVLIAIDDNK